MASGKKTSPGKAAKAGAGKKKKAEQAKGKTKLPAKKKAPKQLPLVQRKSAAELRVERFIAEYIVDFDGRRAAIAAGFSPDRARQTASELLARPEVQAAVQEKLAAITEKLNITKEQVLERFHAIGTADPRELTELHRGCCRYCWGKGYLYQRTPREMREDLAKWEQDELKRQADGKPPTEFNEAGGEGYNPKRDPNPECPECFGDGELRVVFKDTRDLSPAARLLYAGVEQTQHGLKVRTHSQIDAMVHVGKSIGMFTQKHEHTGPDGKPIQHHHEIDELLDLADHDTGPGPAASRRG